MFIRVKTKPNGKRSIQIVESIRRGNKVSQKIVRHIGQASNDREEEVLKKLGQSIIQEISEERDQNLPLFAPEKILSKPKLKGDQIRVNLKDLREEQRIIDGIFDVFGKLYSDLGFDYILGKANEYKSWNKILKTCVLARIAQPTSKRETASFLERDFGIKVPLEKIYRMMDRLVKKEDVIKESIRNSSLNILPAPVDVIFFDVTTLHFESILKDELKEFGYSKDGKFKETQVVLALVTTHHGLPISYHLFPGNTFEGHTLKPAILELKKTYKIENIVLVADRGMLSKDNLQVLRSCNVKYIVGTPLKKLPKNLKTKILSDEDFQPEVILNEMHWCKEFEYNQDRLIVSYSSKRAKKDLADRQRLIDRLMKKVKSGKISIKKLIPNYGSKKYITITGGSAQINKDKIENDAQWDGLFGISTNIHDKSVKKILERYRGLWQIEEAFRVNKHSLRMRPIYHWTENRIKAHIDICFIAYTLVKQLLYRLEIQQQKMSFDKVRNELLHAQSTIVTDISTNNKFIIPSKLTISQKKIYHAFGLKRSETPFKI
jgi:transposase